MSAGEQDAWDRDGVVRGIASEPSVQRPLNGVRIIEIASIGPGPFCGMMLADHGAEVIRIERPGGVHAGLDLDPAFDVMLRGRERMTADLKTPEGRDLVLGLIEKADGLIEGFRPGVMERLGLGPDAALAINPRLVYGRMTGWGQSGPLSPRAGHDINYLALSGVLSSLGRAGEKPTPPINLLGDFGGGGLMLAFGMVSALLAVRAGGEGRVVDAAITEGTSLLATMIWSLRAAGMWNDSRGTNTLDTGAPYYETYETADGKYVAVGAIEPQFYAALLKVLGCSDDPDFARREDPAAWPLLKEKFAAIFRKRSRDYWERLFEGTDACVTPVLDLDEAVHHPHNRSRNAFGTDGGMTQPGAAPVYIEAATGEGRSDIADLRQTISRET